MVHGLELLQIWVVQQKKQALYALKKWCTRNNLNFQRLSDKVEETYTYYLPNDDFLPTVQEENNIIKQKEMETLNKELDMTKPEINDYNMETDTSRHQMKIELST